MDLNSGLMARPPKILRTLFLAANFEDIQTLHA